jgi:hypothetical protein
LIGGTCKHGNVFSGPVLIVRGLDLNTAMSLWSSEGARSHRARSQASGGHSGGETPLPIPNRAVKPASADGTRRATSRESRTPPDFHSKRASRPFSTFSEIDVPLALDRGRLDDDVRRRSVGRPAEHRFDVAPVGILGRVVVTFPGQTVARPPAASAAAWNRSTVLWSTPENAKWSTASARRRPRGIARPRGRSPCPRPARRRPLRGRRR